MERKSHLPAKKWHLLSSITPPSPPSDNIQATLQNVFDQARSIKKKKHESSDGMIADKSSDKATTRDHFSFKQCALHDLQLDQSDRILSLFHSILNNSSVTDTADVLRSFYVVDRVQEQAIIIASTLGALEGMTLNLESSMGYHVSRNHDTKLFPSPFFTSTPSESFPDDALQSKLNQKAIRIIAFPIVVERSFIGFIEYRFAASTTRAGIATTPSDTTFGYVRTDVSMLENMLHVLWKDNQQVQQKECNAIELEMMSLLDDSSCETNADPTMALIDNQKNMPQLLDLIRRLLNGESIRYLQWSFSLSKWESHACVPESSTSHASLVLKSASGALPPISSSFSKETTFSLFLHNTTTSDMIKTIAKDEILLFHVSKTERIILVRKHHLFFTSDALQYAFRLQSVLKWKSRLHQVQHELQEDNHRIIQLYKVVRKVNAAQDAGLILKILTIQCCRLFQCERVTIFMADNVKNELWFVSARASPPMFSSPFGEGLSGAVAQSKESVVIDNAYQDPRFSRAVDKKTGFRTRSVAAFPILAPSMELIGVLQAINRSGEPGIFNARDIQLLHQFCEEISPVLKRHSQQLMQAKVKFDASYGEERERQIQSLLSMTSNEHSRSPGGVEEGRLRGTTLTWVFFGLVTFKLLLIRSRRKRSTSNQSLLRRHVGRDSFQNELSFEGFDTFNVFETTNEQLERMIFQIFDFLGHIDHFQIDVHHMNTFISRMRKLYRENAYHNFKHAFTVVQVVYLLIYRSSASSVLTTLDEFAVLIAALGHDADHPGHDNAAEIQMQSQLARIYNDQSVLENHHSAKTFEVLRDPECSILSSFSQAAQGQLRKSIIRCILSTDMSHHSELLDNISSKSSMGSFSYCLSADRQLLLEFIMHTADLSSQSFALKISLEWTRRICEEFDLQAKEYRRRDWPVPNHMKNLDDPTSVNRLQVGFIDYVVKPLWVHASALLHPIGETFLNNMIINRVYFEERSSPSNLIDDSS